MLVKKSCIQNLYFIYVFLPIRLANKPVSNYENSYLATRLRKKDIWNEFLINESQCDFFRLIDLIRLHPPRIRGWRHITFQNNWLIRSQGLLILSQFAVKLACYRQGHRSSCPFRKRSFKNFWPVIESVSIKKKDNRNPGANLDLSYPNLSPLPLHYHTDPPKLRKH